MRLGPGEESLEQNTPGLKAHLIRCRVLIFFLLPETVRCIKSGLYGLKGKAAFLRQVFLITRNGNPNGHLSVKGDIW